MAGEEAELKGYRVQLRVVEEHEVALLAESPGDAKARAEAEVRGGAEFEASGSGRRFITGPRHF